MSKSDINAKENIFDLPDYKGCGIYAIVNAEDFKAYVGSTKNIRKRAREHSKTLIQGKHANSRLQADIGKDLRFIILHKFNNDISEQQLRRFEMMYMVTLCRNNFELYNIINASDRDIKDICYRLVCDMLYDLGTDKKLNNAIKEEYGVATGYLHARKPKNRNKN